MISCDQTKWLVGIRDLLTELSRQGLEEFEIARSDYKLYVRWEAAAPGNVSSDTTASRGELVAGTGLLQVTAPFAGIVYLSPSPRDPYFVTQGEMVEVGQVVALIEAMKLFNEIRSEFSGRVVRIHVESGQLVEAGQVLLEIQGV